MIAIFISITMIVTILLTILLGRQTVLSNATENQASNDNKVIKTTSDISKSIVFGIERLPDLDTLKASNNPTKYVLMDRDSGIKVEPTKMPKPPKKKTTHSSNSKQRKATIKKNGINNTKKLSYSENDLYILSHLIYAEAGNQNWDFQVATGSVVLNRVKSNKFPNSIKGVVFQRGQYACTWDGNYNKTPSKQAKNVAKYLLQNGSQLPSYVIWQAEFKQGKGVYKKLGNTYFCY